MPVSESAPPAPSTSAADARKFRHWMRGKRALSDAEIAAAAPAHKFHYWQWRTIIATLVGYSLFYFVRKNLSMAMPGMQADLGITKASLGLFLTLHGVVYGVSKFINGMVGDRVNSRVFMVTGLVLSAACNIIFGFNSAVFALGLVWVVNGWFQGMGFPPCARLITHWVPPRELATKMSVWNASHSIGAGLVVILCGYLVNHFGWRWCFWLPSGIALAGGVGVLLSLRDTPSSVGLPELPGTAGKDAAGGEKNDEFRRFIRKHVFLNPAVWINGLCCFFVYTMRYAVLDWGPTLLGEWKHVPIEKSGWMVAGFEIAGIAGMLLAGWATDRFFGGRGARVCVVMMALATTAVALLWLLPANAMIMSALLMTAGFFIYGPQALTGVIAVNTVTRRAAATVIGFTSLFSYASTVLSGWGLGLVAQTWGWGAGLGVLCAAGLAGTLVFAFLWKIKPADEGE